MSWWEQYISFTEVQDEVPKVLETVQKMLQDIVVYMFSKFLELMQ